MEVTRIADGLWRWSTYYGEWRDQVGSVYVEADDTIVVVDPLVPEERDEAERFWRALDEGGGEPPFAIEYIAVDRGDKRPPELLRDLDLRYVPTFIVRRGGEEVGRMVEESPGGIERDLL